MKKIIMTTLLLAAFAAVQAQTTNTAITEHDPAVKAKDDQIKTQLIDPARGAANGQAPDWDALTKTITAKYDAVTADRTVTKAKIYFYYGKDWPAFCAGIVNYTDKYELASDYKILNTNAGMILQNSSDPSQLKEALKWAKAAAAGDPDSQQYQATVTDLQQKITK